MVGEMPLLEAHALTKWFSVRRGLFDVLRRKREHLRAVDGVTLRIRAGEILGVVGESGSGKTTLGRLLLKLIEPTSGSIKFNGRVLDASKDGQLKAFRRCAQPIFQDPYDSLNPRKKVKQILAEPLVAHGERDYQAILKALEDVKLVPPEDFLDRFPHELSGGQRQRVAIAKALVLRPSFIVADEPVSMLDASVRAEILNLLMELRNKYGISILFITHDLAVASYLCDRLMVMYLGKVVEEGSTDAVVRNPLHPYTLALLRAVPRLGARDMLFDLPIGGEMPSAINPPSGCRFHPRCPYAMKRCKMLEPPLVDVGEGHRVSCLLYG